MTRTLVLLVVAVGIASWLLAGCETGSAGALLGGQEVSQSQAADVASVALIAGAAVYAANAVEAAADGGAEATGARYRLGMGGPGGMMDGPWRLGDGTTCTPNGEGWRLRRPDGADVQVTPGEGGCLNIEGPRGNRFRVDAPWQPGQPGQPGRPGRHGFAFQQLNGEGRRCGPRIQVVPNEDGSIEVRFPGRTLLITQNEDGTLTVTEDGDAVCLIEASRDEESIVLTMPSGHQLIIVPNEDGSLEVTLPNGTTTTVPAPEATE